MIIQLHIFSPMLKKTLGVPCSFMVEVAARIPVTLHSGACKGLVRELQGRSFTKNQGQTPNNRALVTRIPTKRTPQRIETARSIAG